MSPNELNRKIQAFQDLSTALFNKQPEKLNNQRKVSQERVLKKPSTLKEEPHK